MDNQKCQFNNLHQIKQEELIIYDDDDLDEEIELEHEMIEEFEIVNADYYENNSPLLDINDISRYMIEIAEILKSNELINLPNVLSLNKYMQIYLDELRNKILDLIDRCKDLYKHNADLLMRQCKPNSYKSKACYCRAPFFKNSNFYPCWSHPDYQHRKEVLKEFFPINVQLLKSCTWTLRDKVDLLQGLKMQMLKYKGGEKSVFDSSDKRKIKVYSEQVKTLYDEFKGDENFSFNFKKLSSETLKGRHDSYSCAGMWNMYMRPDINRTEFTESENKSIHLAIHTAVENYNCFDWYEIASSIHNRTALQCIIQYWTVIVLRRYDQPTSSYKWTKEKDKLLIELVKQHTIGNNIQWIKVCPHFPNLAKNRIIARYFYSCKPGLSKGKF